MIKRLNFTGRVKIKQSSVSLKIINSGTPNVAFSCSVDLNEYKFPDDAEVYIDVYRGSYIRKRFQFGTVKSTKPLVNIEIREFKDFPVFNFKLFVVDTRKGFKQILGLTSPFNSFYDGSFNSEKSLLPVKYVNNINQIWKIDYETERAILLLNSEKRNMPDLIKNDKFFRYTVLPAAFREILFKLFIVEGVPEDEEENDSYKGKWLSFIVNRLDCKDDLQLLTRGDEDDSDIDSKSQLEAIERIVDTFCKKVFSDYNASVLRGE